MVKKAVNEGKNPADQPTGFGSVSGVPNLPAGFVQTFKSRFVNVDGLRLHAVIGGGGPPLLLGGWPQIWYSWRFVMPALAKDFTVIAVNPRGVGLSDKPAKGYDSATLARDLFGLMAELGYERFAMVGHDIGMLTGYAWRQTIPVGSKGWSWQRQSSPVCRRHRRYLAAGD